MVTSEDRVLETIKKMNFRVHFTSTHQAAGQIVGFLSQQAMDPHPYHSNMELILYRTITGRDQLDSIPGVPGVVPKGEEKRHHQQCPSR